MSGTVPLSSTIKIQQMAEDLVENPSVCKQIVGPETFCKQMSKTNRMKDVSVRLFIFVALIVYLL
jgi:hypothetical protein